MNKIIEENKELVKLMRLLVEDNLSLRGREDLYKEIILLIQENQQLKEDYNKLATHLYNEQDKRIELKDRIDKALRKIENMFDLGNGETIIDDLLELDKILKGEK